MSKLVSLLGLDRVRRSTLDFQLEQLVLGENVNALDSTSLVPLKTYQYKSVDKSLLSKYILNPYWTWCAQFMPRWLAPNVITLLGIIAIYINIACIEIYIPDLVSTAPSWVYFSFAFGLFFYQTMDNIDGKQARRTNMSSPLGELFDHGIDSLNCCLGGLVQAVCMGLGSSPQGALTTFSTCIAMYLSTWETYHTHVLYLGVVNGPTEGIIIAVLFMLVTAVSGGPDIWRIYAGDAIPSMLMTLFRIPSDWQLKDVWVAVVVGSVLFVHAPFCLYNVYVATKRRGESYLDTLVQLVPIFVFSLGLYLWLDSPYSSLLSDNHLVLFTLAVSLTFGRMTTSIILAHLTKQQFPFWSLLQMPLLLGALVFGLLPHIGLITPIAAKPEAIYIWGYFVFALIYFVRYSQLVIDALCEFLDIPCFTVKQRPSTIRTE